MSATPEGQEPPYKRGQLEPIWSRLHEHDQDIQELHKASAKAHERVNATDQALVNLREDLREWKDQTHRDSTAILDELRQANDRTYQAQQDAAKAAGAWKALAWIVPLSVTGVGTIASVLFIGYRVGAFG